MHPFRILFCLLPLLLAGCATPASEYAPQPVQASSDAPYVNIPSGFRFPSTVAGFTRGNITQYAPHEEDIGVGYNDAAHGIAVTVYVYPVPPGRDGEFERHFEACKSEIAVRHVKSAMISEEQVEVTSGGTPHPGVHATYTFNEVFSGTSQPLRSELYLFMVDHWFIKYRITYPDSQTSAAAPAVASFMNGLVWP